MLNITIQDRILGYIRIGNAAQKLGWDCLSYASFAMLLGLIEDNHNEANYPASSVFLTIGSQSEHKFSFEYWHQDLAFVEFRNDQWNESISFPIAFLTKATIMTFMKVATVEHRFYRPKHRQVGFKDGYQALLNEFVLISLQPEKGNYYTLWDEFKYLDIPVNCREEWNQFLSLLPKVKTRLGDGGVIEMDVDSNLKTYQYGEGNFISCLDLSDNSLVFEIKIQPIKLVDKEFWVTETIQANFLYVHKDKFIYIDMVIGNEELPDDLMNCFSTSVNDAASQQEIEQAEAELISLMKAELNRFDLLK